MDYNWWDDRTAECEDYAICPITMQGCYNINNCDECEIHIQFVKDVMEHRKEEQNGN